MGKQLRNIILYVLIGILVALLCIVVIMAKNRKGFFGDLYTQNLYEYTVLQKEQVMSNAMEIASDTIEIANGSVSESLFQTAMMGDSTLSYMTSFERVRTALNGCEKLQMVFADGTILFSTKRDEIGNYRLSEELVQKFSLYFETNSTAGFYFLNTNQFLSIAPYYPNNGIDAIGYAVLYFSNDVLLEGVDEDLSVSFAAQNYVFLSESQSLDSSTAEKLVSLSEGSAALLEEDDPIEATYFQVFNMRSILYEEGGMKAVDKKGLLVAMLLSIFIIIFLFAAIYMLLSDKTPIKGDVLPQPHGPIPNAPLDDDRIGYNPAFDEEDHYTYAETVPSNRMSFGEEDDFGAFDEDEIAPMTKGMDFGDDGIDEDLDFNGDDGGLNDFDSVSEDFGSGGFDSLNEDFDEPVLSDDHDFEIDHMSVENNFDAPTNNEISELVDDIQTDIVFPEESAKKGIEEMIMSDDSDLVSMENMITPVEEEISGDMNFDFETESNAPFELPSDEETEILAGELEDEPIDTDSSVDFTMEDGLDDVENSDLDFSDFNGSDEEISPITDDLEFEESLEDDFASGLDEDIAPLSDEMEMNFEEPDELSDVELDFSSEDDFDSIDEGTETKDSAFEPESDFTLTDDLDIGETNIDEDTEMFAEHERLISEPAIEGEDFSAFEDSEDFDSIDEVPAVETIDDQDLGLDEIDLDGSVLDELSEDIDDFDLSDDLIENEIDDLEDSIVEVGEDQSLPLEEEVNLVEDQPAEIDFESEPELSLDDDLEGFVGLVPDLPDESDEEDEDISLNLDQLDSLEVSDETEVPEVGLDDELDQIQFDEEIVATEDDLSLSLEDDSSLEEPTDETAAEGSTELHPEDEVRFDISEEFEPMELDENLDSEVFSEPLSELPDFDQTESNEDNLQSGFEADEFDLAPTDIEDSDPVLSDESLEELEDLVPDLPDETGDEDDISLDMGQLESIEIDEEAQTIDEIPVIQAEEADEPEPILSEETLDEELISPADVTNFSDESLSDTQSEDSSESLIQNENFILEVDESEDAPEISDPAFDSVDSLTGTPEINEEISFDEPAENDFDPDGIMDLEALIPDVPDLSDDDENITLALEELDSLEIETEEEGTENLDDISEIEELSEGIGLSESMDVPQLNLGDIDNIELEEVEDLDSLIPDTEESNDVSPLSDELPEEELDMDTFDEISSLTDDSELVNTIGALDEMDDEVAAEIEEAQDEELIEIDEDVIFPEDESAFVENSYIEGNEDLESVAMEGEDLFNIDDIMNEIPSVDEMNDDDESISLDMDQLESLVLDDEVNLDDSENPLPMPENGSEIENTEQPELNFDRTLDEDFDLDEELQFDETMLLEEEPELEKSVTGSGEEPPFELDGKYPVADEEIEGLTEEMAVINVETDSASRIIPAVEADDTQFELEPQPLTPDEGIFEEDTISGEIETMEAKQDVDIDFAKIFDEPPVKLSTIDNVEAYADVAIDLAKNSLNIGSVAILKKLDGAYTPILNEGFSSSIEFGENDPLVTKFLNQKKSVDIRGDLKKTSYLKNLLGEEMVEELEEVLIVPVVSGDDIAGIAVYGRHRETNEPTSFQKSELHNLGFLQSE